MTAEIITMVVRKPCNVTRKIYKLANMNYVKKNLFKKIYKIKPKFKELNTRDLFLTEKNVLLTLYLTVSKMQ